MTISRDRIAFFFFGIAVGLACLTPFLLSIRSEAANNYYAKSWLYYRTVSSIAMYERNNAAPEGALARMGDVWRNLLWDHLYNGMSLYPKDENLENIALSIAADAELYGWTLPLWLRDYIKEVSERHKPTRAR